MFRLMRCLTALVLFACVLTDGLAQLGCPDTNACNYDVSATSNEACDYCSCSLDTSSFYTFSVEAFAEGIVEGMVAERPATLVAAGAWNVNWSVPTLAPGLYTYTVTMDGKRVGTIPLMHKE